MNSETSYSINTQPVLIICYFVAVMKFRQKSRFLEFFVQVLLKILNEEKFQWVLEWAGNVQVYLKR